MEGGHWGMVEELVKVEGWRSGLTFSSAGTGLEVEETLLADLQSQSVSRQLTLGDLNLLERRGGRGSAAGHAGVGRVLSGAGAGQARQERLLGLRRHHTWTPRCYHSMLPEWHHGDIGYSTHCFVWPEGGRCQSWSRSGLVHCSWSGSRSSPPSRTELQTVSSPAGSFLT